MKDQKSKQSRPPKPQYSSKGKAKADRQFSAKPTLGRGRPPRVRPDGLALALEHGVNEAPSIAKAYMEKGYDTVNAARPTTKSPPSNIGLVEVPSPAGGQPHGYSSTDIPLPPDASTNQILDRTITRTLRSGGAINLDEAFPNIGVANNVGENDATPANPAERARLALIHGEAYQKEYILKTLHRLMLRRVPTDQIARVFNVRVETVRVWMHELYKRVREEAQNLDVYSIAGESLAFYTEIRSVGMNMAASKDLREKDLGLSVALKAEADKHKMLGIMGFYQVAQLIPANNAVNDPHSADSVVTMMKDILTGNYKPEEQNDEVVEEKVDINFFK